MCQKTRRLVNIILLLLLCLLCTLKKKTIETRTHTQHRNKLLMLYT